jgi:predicted RNase H-like HicB family nuclease
MNNSTLAYWRDGAWYVGRLREAPGVFSQGRTLVELEENIREVFRLMLGEPAPAAIFFSGDDPCPMS